MKKILLALIILATAVFVAPFSYKVQAEESIKIETLYPSYIKNEKIEKVIEYADLTDISLMTTDNNYIAYASNDKLNIFDNSNKTTKEVANIEKIKKIKFFNYSIICASNNTINLINPQNATNTLTLSEISYSDNAKVNFYFDSNTLFIGIIDTHLYIYKINITNNDISNSDIIKKSVELNLSEHTPFALTLNHDFCYILSENNDKSNTADPIYLCKVNISTGNIAKEEGFKKDAKLIEVFNYNGNDYFITFINDLFILDSNLNEIIRISTSSKKSNNSDIFNFPLGTQIDSNFPIQSISDVQVLNNKLFVCDSDHKIIGEFNLSLDKDTNKIKLVSNKVLISSSNSDIGRFDNVNNIYHYSNKIYISDTNNNRIQIIDNETSNIDCIKNTNIKQVAVDKNGHIFYISTDNSNTVNKYISEEETTSINKYKSSLFGEIIQLELDNTNKLYLLDYTHKKIYIFTTDFEFEKYISLPTITNNAKLEYVKDINKLVLLDNNVLYLVNEADFSSSTTFTLNNCTDITTGLSQIFALNGNKIEIISAKDGAFTKKQTIENNHFDNFSTISYDIANGKLYGFNIKRQCLEFISLDTNLPFDNSSISNEVALEIKNQAKPLTSLNTSAIYQYPYNLGTCYHTNEIVDVIAIEEFDIYYKVLLNYNDTATVGYVEKEEANVIKITSDPVSVRVTNPQIPVYKYPTLLAYGSSAITVDTLDLNTIITLSAQFPVSIDGKDFYIYIYGDKFGYIFSADVVLSTGNNLTYFHNENATINSFNESSVTVYNEDLTTKVDDIANNKRIYVENFDKKSEWTQIIYKTDNNQEKIGYIKTEYINMDGLASNQIILIVVMSISIILLISIITVYFVIKKKK
ncbi:MAG: hypothetical protein E7345_00930 [Clostridiales bacterium]|nr:hypothetical protein [Clostridiales bacterium]